MVRSTETSRKYEQNKNNNKNAEYTAHVNTPAEEAHIVHMSARGMRIKFLFFFLLIPL